MTNRALWTVALAAVVSLAAGCGGKRTVGPKTDEGGEFGSTGDDDDGKDTGDGKGDPPPPQTQMVTQIEWVTTERAGDPPTTEVMISLTDETGAVEHEPIGTFTGGCTEGIDDDATPGAIIGLRCWHAGAGESLRIVRQGSELIVLRALLEEELDEVSYDIHMRIEIRTDATIRGPQ